jgi:signal transduction histidine kinase
MPQSIDSYLQLPRRKYLSAIEIHAAVIGSIAAVILLFGWGLGIEPLTGRLPGFTAITPMTAACFMALSVSSLAAARNSRRGDVVSALLSVTVVGVLVTTIFVKHDPAVIGTWMQLTSKAVAVCLSLGAAGLAVMVLAPNLTPLAGILAVAGAAPPIYRLVGVVVWNTPASTNQLVEALALHVSVLVVWFLTLCVVLHPRMALAARVLQSSLRGRLLRRSLPLMAAAPPIAVVVSLGVSTWLGFAQDMRFATTATLGALMSISVVWWVSSVVEIWQKEANAQTALLSRANEALEQYASSAAHDLKAPARHVLLYGEMLREALERGDSAGALRHAESIQACALEMPRLINGLLDHSRSGFVKIEPGDFLLSEIIQSASALQAEDLRTVGAKVVVTRDITLRCDSTLMVSVFQNLIANSLKNRRKDRQLVIRIDAEVDDGMILISVEDNGVGFDPEFAAVAFNPLARGVRTAGEGAGIGLATCRTIIQGHGGTIRVDPTHKSGARIEFTLPITGLASKTAQSVRLSESGALT